MSYAVLIKTINKNPKPAAAPAPLGGPLDSIFKNSGPYHYVEHRSSFENLINVRKVIWRQVKCYALFFMPDKKMADNFCLPLEILAVKLFEVSF